MKSLGAAMESSSVQIAGGVGNQIARGLKTAGSTGEVCESYQRVRCGGELEDRTAVGTAAELGCAVKVSGGVGDKSSGGGGAIGSCELEQSGELWRCPDGGRDEECRGEGNGIKDAAFVHIPSLGHDCSPQKHVKLSDFDALIVGGNAVNDISRGWRDLRY